MWGLVSVAACQSPNKIVENTAAPTELRAGWHNADDYFTELDTARANLIRWRYSAKVGISSSKVSETANLVWQFNDQSHDVRLFGPLGIGAIKLEFDDYGVQLSDSNGVLYRGSSAEDLLTEVVGWPLPIDALSYWLFLVPSPHHPFQYQINDANQLASIRQLGWQIDFTSYQPYGANMLPRKISAFRRFEDTELGDVRVKLISKSWQR
jgi:outer membrane lipoprotein LolB